MAKTPDTAAEGLTLPGRLRRLVPDFRASLVVFLVAVPLCVGVAVASGVPAELGIITGIIGGLVAGAMPGSSLQVSGPAAGLTVLVTEAVAEHGLAALGVLVAGAGLLQILLGLVRLGTWFQAISPSVVQGMLAGIGLVLILGQLYPMFGHRAPGDTLGKLTHLPGLFAGVGSSWAPGLGVLTLTIILAWDRLPARWRAVPAPLVAVAVAAALAAILPLGVATVEVGSVVAALDPPGPERLGLLADPAVLGTILTFALVASAESMFSAAAVDRMHDGPPRPGTTPSWSPRGPETWSAGSSAPCR
ncbi:SulP family inorganic anion transporter [Amycolatopsis thermoflava]|uniref:SulP family inorganic anion transporter n=1 Tax=Amycolatopsis sp. NPDC006125 TaxID=3156730 RepID=UPI0033B9228C